MREKLTVVYKNGCVLVMPFVRMDYDFYMKRHPEIVRMYRSYAPFKGFVYRSI